MGDVGKHVAEDAAVEGAGLVAAVIQDAGPGGQVVHRLGGVEGGVLDLGLRPVFERLEVEAEDGLLAVHLGFLVEALSGFAAEVTVVDQVLHEGGRLEDGLALVVGAVVLHPIGHMHQRVEAHHIAGAERGALRAAHRRAGELVHRLDAESHVLHGVEQRLDGKHAHAVRNERRGVLAEHGGLAEAVAAIGHEEVDQLRGAAGVRDDLQQGEVARRVEEVRAAEAGLEVVAPALGEVADGNAGRVGGDGRAGLAVLLDLLKQDALDVQPLDDDLDDPVAIRNLGHVVLEVARGDAVGEGLPVQGAGLGFDAGLEVPVDGGVARAFLGRQVEEQDLVAGLGEVAGNRAAHHAGAENGDAVEGMGEGRGSHGQAALESGFASGPTAAMVASVGYRTRLMFSCCRSSRRRPTRSGPS